MTFFEHQDRARRNTRLALALFILAVAAIVLLVNAAAAVVWMWSRGTLAVPPPALHAWTTLATLAVIVGVSLSRTASLRGGGSALALMAGARVVDSGTADPLERRLLNVVEEMAIAAGLRVPRVYLMDGEKGLNSFAAGYDVSSAVIAVTRGALETLNRDELQAVVGHELSHIVNADAALNLRIVGMLAGIVFVAAIGESLMQQARHPHNKDALSEGFLGMAVFLAGYPGFFLGRLIKGAVSREREFLADASSVQFTRNPEGIAGALDRIRASPRGTLVDSRFAEEMSHMFIAQAVVDFFSARTHPLMEERIRRVRPGFRAAEYRARRAPDAVPAGSGGRRGEDRKRRWGLSPAQSLALVGLLEAGNVEYAAALIASLPADLKQALREPAGAAAAIAALLLAPKEDIAQEQLAAFGAAGADAFSARARGLAPLMRGLPEDSHLPIIDLALSEARALGEEMKRALIAGLEALAGADRRVSLREYVVLALVRSQLAPPPRPPRAYRSLAERRGEAALLLSLVAHVGGAPEAAFRAGIAESGLEGAPLTPREMLSVRSIQAALEALRSLAPLAKARLVRGLFAAATSDGTISLGEAELVRLVGAVLECPLPPLFTSS